MCGSSVEVNWQSMFLKGTKGNRSARLEHNGNLLHIGHLFMF